MKNIAFAILSVGLCFYQVFRVYIYSKIGIQYPESIDWLASVFALAAAVGVFWV